MQLERIKIEKLFGKFDYDIKLNRDEGITILTGPNGYGKTTILNIIANLFNGECPKYNLFSSLTCFFSNGQKLRYSKVKQEKSTDILSVYQIKDQRLEPVDVKNRFLNINLTYKPKDKFLGVIIKRIAECLQTMVDIISKTQNSEQQMANNLNATYAERLFEYKTALPEAEFSHRFLLLEQKYRLLLNYGIYKDELKKAAYEKENQRALSIYLEDWEKKTAVYDDLLTKLEIFLNLLNRKRFTNKTAIVKAGEGFVFSADDGKEIPLDALSSGEQNETIILFELLFKVKPETLVLIDEPETSLHVSWQHDFLHDLKVIRTVNPVSFLIATHSPSIINENWDLTQDLSDLANQPVGAAE